IKEHTIPYVRCRYGTQRRLYQRLLQTFECSEEKESVLNDGPTQGSAVNVASKLSSRLPSLVQKVIVGVKRLVTVRVVSAAVNGIRSAIGNQLHLGGRRASAGVGSIVGRRRTEFGERRLRDPHRTSEGVPFNWVIAIHPVESNVRLIAASTIHRSA